MSKVVSQLDPQGYFLCTVIADESPLEEGVLLIPGGAVDVAPPDIAEGKRYRLDETGNAWVAEDIPQPEAAPAPTLDDLKAAKAVEINAGRLQANFAGFMFGGHLIATDTLSRSDIDGVAGYVGLYGTMPPDWPGFWKADDNAEVPMPDTATFKDMYAAMVGEGNANFAKSQVLKAQLAAATTAEQVAAITW
jgi:hypothetical protein